jgi:predicted transposase YbfD/YdcC
MLIIFLLLECKKPKFLARRNPVGRTCCNTSHKNFAPVSVRIRFHWGVESNNWIRDVTFNEDHIKTKAQQGA